MRVALVTGGARGIGEAIARRLEQDGLRVVVADLAPGSQEEVDLSVEEDVRAMARRVLEREGRVDVLVNNAGILTAHAFEDVDLATWRRFQAVNLEPAFLLAQELLPGMVDAGWGRIVNIVTGLVWKPGPRMVPYIASKAGLLGFTRALATELAGTGVTVNAVGPGLTPTEGSAHVGDEGYARVLAAQAVRRPLVPDDVAAAVAYFASEGASAVTGQSLRTDGGIAMV